MGKQDGHIVLMLAVVAIILGVCAEAWAGDPLGDPPTYQQHCPQVMTQMETRYRTVYDTVMEPRTVTKTRMVPRQRTVTKVRMVPQEYQETITEHVPEQYQDTVQVARQVPRQEAYQVQRQYQMVPVQTYAEPCPQCVVPMAAPVATYAAPARETVFRKSCIRTAIRRALSRRATRKTAPRTLVAYEAAPAVSYGYGIEK